MLTGSAILALAFMSSFASTEDKGEWKEYASAEGRFKVLFPSNPRVSKVPNRKPELHRIGVRRSSEDSLGYLCYWSIKDRPFRSKELAAAYLIGVQTGALKSSKGLLDGDNVIELAGLPGREFFVKISDSNYLRCRAYVNGRYVYTLQVWGRNKNAVSSADAEKFLKSLVVKQESTGK